MGPLVKPHSTPTEAALAAAPSAPLEAYTTCGVKVHAFVGTIKER